MPKEVGPGFIRNHIPFHIGAALLVGTGALVVINAKIPGYKCVVEKVFLVTEETLVGAGGTQTFVVRKGSTTGTALVSIVPTVADHAVIGTVLSAIVSAALDQAAHLGDDDTISITRTVGGTSITAGAMSGWVVIRQRPQARS